MQNADRVQNFARGVGRDADPPGEVGADGDEYCIEPLHKRGVDVIDPGVELQGRAQVDYASNLGVQDVPRQTVFGNAETHHAARHGPGLADRDGVPLSPQMIGGGQPAGSGADDEYLFARGVDREVRRPPALERLIAQETLYRIDAYRRIQLAAVAHVFTRVIANPAHDRGQRVVFHQFPPRSLVVAFLGVIQPVLNIFPGRAGIVARWQSVYIHRARCAPRSGQVGEAGAGIQCNGEGELFHAL